MDFKVQVVEKISNKTKQPYIALEVTFPNGYKKMVFLDEAEKFFLKQ